MGIGRKGINMITYYIEIESSQSLDGIDDEEDISLSTEAADRSLD